jgi:serine/threonine protein kinase
MFQKRTITTTNNEVLKENKRFKNNKNIVSKYIEINENRIYKEDMILDYKILKQLQSGYSGYIFLCKNLKTDEKTVIKCCEKYSSYEREYYCLQKLRHSNIVKLKGKGVIQQIIRNKYFENIDSKKYNIIPLEYAEKGDLYTYLQKSGALSEEAVKVIAYQILDGLNYAFSFGISHRDIKLENILITKDSKIIIGDWGLAAINTDKRMCSSSCGTLGYMSPEMICRKEYYAEKSDIWALGVLLFSLLTNTRPYSEPSRRKNIDDNEFSWMDEWLSSMVNKKWKLFWLSHEKCNNIILSKNCKLMFEIIFEIDMKKRISIAELMKKKWFDDI